MFRVLLWSIGNQTVSWRRFRTNFSGYSHDSAVLLLEMLVNEVAVKILKIIRLKMHESPACVRLLGLQKLIITDNSEEQK